MGESSASTRVSDRSLIPDDCPSCEEHTMSCMEVWGGNHLTFSEVDMPGLSAHVLSAPFDNAEYGGDIHYVSSCATGRVTRVLVADVSGHGEAVASIADSLRSLMQRFVNYVDQRRFMDALNRQFTKDDHDGAFATAIAVSYWAPTGCLAISNAGHPPPLVRDAATGRWRVAFRRRKDESDVAHDLPLGVISPVAYDEVEAPMRPGDLVLLYSDSLIESRDVDGKELGEEGLVRIAESLGDLAASEFVPALAERVRQRAVNERIEDDVTILALSAAPEARYRMGVTDWARAMARFSRFIGRAMVGRRREIPWPEMTISNIGGALIHRLNLRRRTPEQE